MHLTGKGVTMATNTVDQPEPCISMDYLWLLFVIAYCPSLPLWDIQEVETIQ